jgi:hypothetical protein
MGEICGWILNGFDRKKRIERACSLLYDPVHIPDTGGKSCDCGPKTYDGKSENRRRTLASSD